MAITNIPTNTVTPPATTQRTYTDTTYRASRASGAEVRSNRSIGVWLIVAALVVIAAFAWTSYRNRQDTISSMGASSTQSVNSLAQPTAQQVEAPPVNPAPGAEAPAVDQPTTAPEVTNGK